MYTSMTSIFGVSKLFFGQTSVVTFPYNVIDPIVYALPISLLVTAIVSLATQSSLDLKHVNTCFAFLDKRASSVKLDK